MRVESVNDFCFRNADHPALIRAGYKPEMDVGAFFLTVLYAKPNFGPTVYTLGKDMVNPEELYCIIGTEEVARLMNSVCILWPPGPSHLVRYDESARDLKLVVEDKSHFLTDEEGRVDPYGCYTPLELDSELLGRIERTIEAHKERILQKL